MLDNYFRNIKDYYLTIIIKLIPNFITPNNLTFQAFFIGLVGIYFTLTENYNLALLIWY